jgi:DNA-binding response OmpR family regulator
LFKKLKPDAVLLDVMMPKLDGFAVCREIRKTSTVPVIMITARGEDFEKIMGLDIGADDYIVKPFSPGEVMARLRAVLRRMEKGQKDAKQVFEQGNLLILLDDYTALVDGQEVPLTKKELEILWTLATHTNKVFSRDNLLESLWGYDYFGDSRTVDSHIKRLRAKLEAFHPEGWEIKTIWGVGYKFEVKADEK